MKRLLITRRLTDAVHERAQRDYDAILNMADRVFTRDELVAACQEVDAVLPCHSEHFSAEVIAALPERLRIIANHSVGVDHVDLTAAKAQGVTVTNTPDVLSDATAEIAMLCMLGAARRGAEGHIMVREGKWDFWSPAFMVGRQVTGKRFGVVGMGRVGQV
ncbi:MAG: NAD(P)-dependent oxidoreductase, partial [Pseudomonadota bacterium]